MNKVLLGVLTAAIPALALADPPSATLRSVRLHLSTDTIHVDKYYSPDSSRGFTHLKLIRSEATIKLPGRTFDAYIAENSGENIDFSTISALTKLNKDNKGHIAIIPAANLLKVKYPMFLLISTGLPPFIRIDPALVTKIEQVPGEFEGFSQYGQPFYLPKDQALLLRDKAPIYQCNAHYAEMPDIHWISYSASVGEADLKGICESDFQHRPTDVQIKALLAHEGVFAVGIPTD